MIRAGYCTVRSNPDLIICPYQETIRKGKLKTTCGKIVKNKQRLPPRVPVMSLTDWHLMYKQKCSRGSWPQGDGDILLLHRPEEVRPLRLFLSAHTMAQHIFSPASPPDTLLMDCHLRQALVKQHLEKAEFELSGCTWPLAQITLATKAEGAPETLVNWCYGIPTSLGPAALCMDDNPEIALPGPTKRQARGGYPYWWLPLQCRVGWSSLTLSQLRGLEKGDLVMITWQQQYLTLSGSKIGQWQFDKRGIILERLDNDDAWMFADEQQPHVEEKPQDTLAGFALKDVELMLEVSLGKAAMPLAQAVELQAGDFVPLASGGLKGTRLLLGNQTVAKGELVEIDGQLGVILDHIFFRPEESQ
jgi:flagellar motor switch/type III secretory pathway protein FliN